MGKLIFGAILTALTVFGWEALSWTTIGWHQNGFRAFRDESAVAAVVKANVTSGHGIYLLPSIGSAPKISTAEEKKAFEEEQAAALRNGPYMYAIVRPGKGDVSMTMNLTLSFVRSLICAFLIAGMLSQATLHYPARIAFVASAGLFAGLVADLPMWIWFENPGRDAVVNIADHVIAWMIGGTLLGIFVGKEPVADP